MNKLTSLESCPTEVDGDFLCDKNNLTSLRGVPKWIGDSFSCSQNNLISLRYAPTYVDDSFFCWGNLRKFTEKEVKAVCKVEYYIET